jgi:hypothetical protein
MKGFRTISRNSIACIAQNSMLRFVPSLLELADYVISEMIICPNSLFET